MFRNLLKRYRTWVKATKTMNELYALSDKELSDIGIHRGMIRSIVYETVE